MVNRLPGLTPDRLDPEQRELYDAIARGPRSRGPQHFPLVDADGALLGPFNAMLLAPGLGAALQEVGAAIRFHGTLDARARELAILVVASRWDSAFERSSHEAVGLATGLTDAELAAVRGRDDTAFSGAEGIVVRVARQLADGDLDDELWDEASSALGAPQIYELTVLVGYYATLALQLRAFRVES